MVEDEPGVRAMTRRCLEKLGYNVLDAANGREALEVYRAYPGVVDLVLTDVIMPEMNGQELLNHLRELQPGLRAAFMSGYPQDVVVREFGTMERNVHFLQKPFSIADLSQVIRETMDS